jgi:hypothetical protein
LAGHVAGIEEKRNAYRLLVGLKPQSYIYKAPFSSDLVQLIMHYQNKLRLQRQFNHLNIHMPIRRQV